MPLDDPGHPANAVDRIAEKVGVSRALQGLKQAIHDIVEEHSELGGQALRLVDSTLATQGLLTFSEIRRRYWSKYQALLKRNVIRNDTEYYLLKGIADDLGAQVPDEERAQVGVLLSQYESK
jgi:hypothetical protein